MTDHREGRNLAGDSRKVRMTATGTERSVSYREAVGLVSRGLATFHVEQSDPEPKKAPVKKTAAKKAAAKKAAPVSAEAVFADPTSPITPQDLPGSAQEGDATDDGEHQPHDLL